MHIFYESTYAIKGRSVADALNLWLLTAEARVQSQGNPCGIYGEQSATEAGVPLHVIVLRMLHTQNHQCFVQ
jgi:hypothetical protein